MVEQNQLERLLKVTLEVYTRTFGVAPSKEQLLESLERLIEKQSRFILDDKLGSLRSPKDLIALREMVKAPAPSPAKVPSEESDAKTTRGRSSTSTKSTGTTKKVSKTRARLSKEAS